MMCLAWTLLCAAAMETGLHPAAVKEKKIRAWAASVLEQEDPFVVLSGHVKDLEETDTAIRLQLDRIRIAAEDKKTTETSAYADVSFAYEGSSRDISPGQILPGDMLQLKGIPVLYEEASNPGEFSYREYYASKGICFHLKDVTILSCRQHRDFATALYLARCRMREAVRRVFTPADAGVLQAMLLGETRQIDSEIRSLYQEGGIAHILAISGLHMSLVGLSLFHFMRKRKVPYAAAAVFSSAVLALYTILTGMRVSSVRAMIMLMIWLLAQSLGRKADLLTSAAIAAAILNGIRPQVLYTSSFYLSFGCVISLHVLSPFFEEFLPLPGRMKQLLSPQAAVMAGTMPVNCYFFYQITPYCILVNLIVIPCTGALFLFAVLASAAGCIHPSMGFVLSIPARFLLRLFLSLCQAERILPSGVLITGQPCLWQIAAYYLLLGAAMKIRVKSRGDEKPVEDKLKKEIRKKKKDSSDAGERMQQMPGKKVSKTWCLRAGTLLLMLCILLFPVRPGIRVVFLDVGQGDCILIQSARHTVLVDGGSSSVSDVWTRRISPCLKAFGIRTLDAVFLTHADADHINGIEELLSEYHRNLAGRNAADISVRTLVVSGASLEKDEVLKKIIMQAEEKGIRITGIYPGDRITLERDVTLTCLYPDEEDALETGYDANQTSLVLWMSAPGLRVLLTGDLEKEGEMRLAEKLDTLIFALEETGPDPPEKASSAAEDKTLSEKVVLKAGHHGAAAASGALLLDTLRPDLAVISCGLHNRYGHPAQVMLDRLCDRGIAVLRTDEGGAVMLSLQAFPGKMIWRSEAYLDKKRS